ncbi:MAG: helix-turn-helix transcriptional regulator [Eubacterium sp.]|nr:helix-turn-helix transcriptional regulator [Eubacterium sp.]
MKSTYSFKKSTGRNNPYINCLSEFLYEVRSSQFRETQESFGDRCGLSQKTISRLENTGHHQVISLNSLIKISGGIGVFPSQFLAQVERVLSEKNPDYTQEFRECLNHYDSVFNTGSADTIDEMLVLLQASLMFIHLIQTKELEQITRDDIMRLYVFFRK